ncbi:metalloregulator ArsR/SmtB family transcription factor [Sphingomonas sp. AR_OL41]|uniref:ArsR/SmtB family transcription factor n=1 Tax=Sphingomonas sp. AR_OL41 TaxID=3042729 RepID=UPI0024805C1D|nr:metalloregulator ArsR/SmtB family transcription factor [Sphingomonas sp. AR_OL41]MDH7971270.1 metalloregulator ArsR/SmtB family transcription factor [Sphingomonas sp. AR_OL41]
MQALQVMSALAQSTRFEVFQRLVDELPQGMASGDLAVATGSSPNTMSAHLAILSRAGLVHSDKVGRTVIYTVDTSKVEELSDFLARACATGKTDDQPARS